MLSFYIIINLRDLVCRDVGCNLNDSNVQKSAEYPASIRRSLVLDPKKSTKYQQLKSSDELSTRRQTRSGSFDTPDITEDRIELSIAVRDEIQKSSSKC